LIIMKRSAVKPGAYHKLAPLTWHFERDYRSRLAPVVVCSNGHESTMTTHTVAADGTVSPSMVCPVEGCQFHEYVQLEGWMSGWR